MAWSTRFWPKARQAVVDVTRKRLTYAQKAGLRDGSCFFVVWEGVGLAFTSPSAPTHARYHHFHNVSPTHPPSML